LAQNISRRTETVQEDKDTNILLLKKMVDHTERGNVRIRKLNEYRRLRRIDTVGLCDISESEEEDPVPTMSSLTVQADRSPELHPTPNEGNRADSGRLGNVEWQALINSQDQVHDPKPAKSDYVDYSVLGPAFSLDEASKNIHELDHSAIPNALKQMAHCRVFIPLSLFTTQALKAIRDNVGDLYTKRKTGLSAGKYILNSDCFRSEDSLTEQTFFQAYRNWLRLLNEVADPEVAKGWNLHHELMINDANFTSSFSAWRAHDRNLRTSFFNAPFVLDVDSHSYIKGFDREWMACEVSSFRKDHSAPPPDSRSFRNNPSQNCSHNPGTNPPHNLSPCYALYDKQ